MTRIEQGRSILKMIEAVDVNDTDTLDEIDARFWCFLKRFEFISAKRRMFVDFQYRTEHKKRPDIEEAPQHWAPQYTRSLDALHGAMPDGWAIFTTETDKGFVFGLENKKDFNIVCVNTEPLPTMHLAWMHALTQAYIYMEGNSNDT